MAALLQTLSGNPFQTPIGQKVEQATDPSLPSEDWALFLEICDMINDTDEGPKDAARAIKRRLQQSAGKNHTVVMYTLTLLETCVKNCGKRFHTLVTSKDFVSDLVKLIGPRNDPPPALQEKVLNLIQTWSDAFRGQPECSGVVQVYNELKSKKVEFPVPDSDSSAPIHTPQRSVPPYRKSTNDSSSLASTNTSVHPSPHQFHSLHRQASSGQASSMMLSAGPANLSTEQLVKLRGELDVVQGNIKVFHEMMDELIPGKEHPDDWALLRDLNTTCQSMQKRIVELIEKVANEEVTNELLRVNDELNNLFERYERYDRKRTAFINSNPGMVGNLSSTTTLPKSLEAQEAGQEPSLIDLNADDVQPNSSLSKGFANLSVGKENPSSKPPAGAGAASDADFDIFAHSRSSISADSKTKASSEAIRTGQVELDLGRNASNASESDSKPLPLDSERDLVEMEKWLQDQTAGTNPPRHQGSGGDVNFEKFLAERAEAIDKMPK